MKESFNNYFLKEPRLEDQPGPSKLSGKQITVENLFQGGLPPGLPAMPETAHVEPA